MINVSRRKWVASSLRATAGCLVGSMGLSGCSSETDAVTAESENAPIPPSSSELPNGAGPQKLGNRTVGIVATEPESGDFGTDVIQRIVNSGSKATSLVCIGMTLNRSILSICLTRIIWLSLNCFIRN